MATAGGRDQGAHIADTTRSDSKAVGPSSFQAARDEATTSVSSGTEAQVVAKSPRTDAAEIRSRAAARLQAFRAEAPSDGGKTSDPSSRDDRLAGRDEETSDAADIRSRAAARLKALRTAAPVPALSESLAGSPWDDAKLSPRRDGSTLAMTSAHPPTFSYEVLDDVFPHSQATGGTENSPGPTPGPHSWAWHKYSRHEPPQTKDGPPKRAPDGGWACPITVQYAAGDDPMLEFTRLDGGLDSHVIVGALEPTSKAYQAGVRPGHALVVVNGKMDFSQLPGWQVRLLLKAPITLGFDPAPGHPAGMPPSLELLLAPSPALRPVSLPAEQQLLRPFRGRDGGLSDWVVAEEIVFKPTTGAPDDADGCRSYVGGIDCWHPRAGLVGGGATIDSMCQPHGGSSAAASASRGNRSEGAWFAPSFSRLVGATCVDELAETATPD
mmetsp:Transcript_50455/g.141205  ORF Transcript_50455/g.141205 Transcript_50455/m.141205 type:complete len:439 (-) Transcript_50455:212-1528(-)